MSDRKSVPRRYRLRAYIFLLVSVVLLAVVAASVETGLRRAAYMMEDDLIFNGRLAAEEIGTYLRSVARPDPVAVERKLLQKLPDAPSVIELSVFRKMKNGGWEIVASSAETPRYVMTQLERFDGTATLIETDDDRVALLSLIPPKKENHAVLVASTLRRVDQFLGASRAWATALSLGGVTLVLLAVNLIFQQRIARPLARIFAVVTRAEDRGERIAVVRDDEIGVIAASINGLLDRVKARTEESARLVEQIHGLNADLQRRIDDATAALTQKNDALARLTTNLLTAETRLLQTERLASAGLMAAVFAHEVGSPLTSLSAHVEMLLEDSRLQSAQKEVLDLMRKQIERVTIIVDDMLRSARRGPDDFTTLNLGDVIGEVLELVAPRLEARGIALAREGSVDLPVRGYAVYLQEALLNLINNATDAVGARGRIAVAAGEEGGVIWVEVRDNGPGIDPKIVSDLGKRFVTTKSVGQGSGLGLSIVHDIVRRHGGTLEFQSGGQGVAARIVLPAARLEKAFS